MPAASRGLLALALSLSLSLAAGAIGGFATASSVGSWYATLNKPAFNPPNTVFGPVWTLLYAVLAYSFWRVLGRLGPDRPIRWPAVAFLVQLFFNALWSVVFFGMHNPALALPVVVALEASVIAMIFAFARIDRLAGALQWPYAFWVAFASLLNLAIVLLNPPI
jgi:tryptophan-rich sensory protein